MEIAEDWSSKLARKNRLRPMVCLFGDSDLALGVPGLYYFISIHKINPNPFTIDILLTLPSTGR